MILFYLASVLFFSLIAAYIIEFTWKQYDIYNASYRVVARIREQPIIRPRFFMILACFVLAIFFTSLLSPVKAASEGRSVAERLGGRLIVPQTRNKKEKQLLNIVEEMSIASGLPVPPLYILEDASINAFAAGAEQSNAVIGVTTGALDYLDRDELQAVIAHEFSHIQNGDVRLAMRLAQLIFGLMFMIELGRGAASAFKPSGSSSGSSKSSGSTSYSGSRSSGGRSSGGSSSRGGGGAGAIILLILAIIAICVIFGFISKIFGLITQAAVSRQREYLADASAVQFTRSAALASALKKIGSQSGMKLAGGSSIYSHFFFSSIGKDWLSSHPPLEKRIRRIDAAWDGTFTKIEGISDTAPSAEDKFLQTHGLWSGSSSLAGQARLRKAASGKRPGQQREILRGLELASHEPWDATCLVLALLLDPQKDTQTKQLEEEKNAAKRRMIACYRESLDHINCKHYLPLIEKSAPALKTMSHTQFMDFRSEMLRYVNYDGGFSFREWIIFQAVEGMVGAQYEEIKHTKPEQSHIEHAALQLAGAMVLSCADDNQASYNLRDCLNIFGARNFDLLQSANHEQLGTCLDILKAAPEQEKDRFLENIYKLIWQDFHESDNELMFMQLMCLCLDRPSPEKRLKG